MAQRQRSQRRVMILVLLLATSVVAGGCRGRHCGLLGGCFGCRGDCPYGCDTSLRSSHRSCDGDCCDSCTGGCDDGCDCGCSECGCDGQIDDESDNTDASTPPLPPVPGSGANLNVPADVSAQNSGEPRELQPPADDKPVAELARRPGKTPSSTDGRRPTEQTQEKKSDTKVPTPSDEGANDEGANADQQPTPATKDAPAPPKTEGTQRADRSPLGYPRVVDIVRPPAAFSSTTKRIGELARTLTGKRDEVIIKAAWNSPPPRPLTIRERGIAADRRTSAKIELKKTDLVLPKTATTQVDSPGTARSRSSLRVNTLRRVRPKSTPTGITQSIEIKTTQSTTESPVAGTTKPLHTLVEDRDLVKKKTADAKPRIIRSTIRFRTKSGVHFKSTEQPALSQRARVTPKKSSSPQKSST
jgi:hypothetical protein